MNWISINDKKPMIGQIIFALIKSRVPVVVKFSGECFIYDGFEVENITHWMNIPEVI